MTTKEKKFFEISDYAKNSK
ncbi:Protein of unknown function [Lactobacillus delbrueckii subsp. lactis]|nr:Protein of unknown function [Lactobacillus delbrueckii subsp. lactis]